MDHRISRFNDVRIAMDEVEAHTGPLGVAFETRSDVYLFALNKMGHATTGLHRSGACEVFRGLVRNPAARRVGMDSAQSADFARRNPNVARIKNV